MSLPTKPEIVAHWADWLDKQGYDYGEPSCWACGQFWKASLQSEKKTNASLEEIFKRWDIKPLQICHILAKQFGGSDSVDNLFLMCKECHIKSPDTTSRKLFLKWAVDQCWITNEIAKYEKEIKTFGLEDRVDEFYDIIGSGLENTPKIIKENLGSHFSKMYGNKISHSTFIAAIALYLEEKDRG